MTDPPRPSPSPASDNQEGDRESASNAVSEFPSESAARTPPATEVSRPNVSDEISDPTRVLPEAAIGNESDFGIYRKDEEESTAAAEVELNMESIEQRVETQGNTDRPRGILKHAASTDMPRKRTQEERLKQPASLDSVRPKLSFLYSPRSGGSQFWDSSAVGAADEEPVSTPRRSRAELLRKPWTSLRSFTTKGDENPSIPRTVDENNIKEESKEADEDEETPEEAAARKLEQRLRQAKKLERFFVKTDVPPRPALVRTKYEQRHWEFDVNNDWLGRSSNWNFFTLKRPFFASFHLAWISFFFCFMGWFAIGPLVPVLLMSGFSKEAIETSNALALASTIIIRFILGPFCEEYGPRLVMTATLALGGILVCATAGVTDAAGLMVARFFIGLIGGAFVPCQFWITMMFSTKIVGFMSGSAAGFGNAGAGVIVFVMGGLLSAFQGAGYTSDQQWRYSLLVPGCMMIACAIPTYFLPADCPQGKWKDKKYGTPADKIGRMAWLRRGGSEQMQKVLKLEQSIGRARWSCLRSLLRLKMFFLTEEKFMAFWDWRAWMVGIQYSVASGVELSILTGLTAYYRFEFGCEGNVTRQFEERTLLLNGTLNDTTTCLALDTSTAAYISAIFGLTNLYGRMVGGGLSDYVANTKGFFRGARGRHFAVFVTLLLQGVTMMIWSLFTDWRASAGFMVLFSSVVHMSKGAVIAIAPFVSPGCVGPVMGVVSAVGNLGGVLMSLMYSGFATSREVFYWQGVICIVGSGTAFMLKVHDLELNRDMWLLSPPPPKEVYDEDEDEHKRKARRTLTSKFLSLRRQQGEAKSKDDPAEEDPPEPRNITSFDATLGAENNTPSVVDTNPVGGDDHSDKRRVDPASSLVIV